MAFLMYLAEMNFNQENGSSSLTSAKDSGLHVPAVPECRALSRPKKIQQPDSLYAYLVCFCGVLCNLIMFGCSYSFGLLFPLLLEESKEGKAKTGNLENTSKMEPFCGLQKGVRLELLTSYSSHQSCPRPTVPFYFF